MKMMQPFVSRHVNFHEDVFPLNKNTDKPYMQPLPTDLPLVIDEIDYVDEEIAEVEPQQQNQAESATISEMENLTDSEIEDANHSQSPEVQQQLRRSARTSKQPTWLDDFVTRSSNTAITATMVAPNQSQFQLFSSSNTATSRPSILPSSS